MNTIFAVRTGRRIGTAIQRGADRALQGCNAVALLLGYRRRDPSVIVNGVVSLLFALLPRHLERRCGVRFRPWQRLWISAAALGHTVGMLGPYDRIWWWDHLTHTLSGVVVAAAADVLFRVEFERADGARPSDRQRAVVVAGATIGFGVLWEALEHVVHAFSERLGFEPLLVEYSRLDTVIDLVFDGLGAAIVVAFGRRALSNVVDSATDR